jgi:hypothetical protein
MRLPLLVPAVAELERAGDPQIACVEANDLAAGMQVAAVAGPCTPKRDRFDVACWRYAVTGGHDVMVSEPILRVSKPANAGVLERNPAFAVVSGIRCPRRSSARQRRSWASARTPCGDALTPGGYAPAAAPGATASSTAPTLRLSPRGSSANRRCRPRPMPKPSPRPVAASTSRPLRWARPVYSWRFMAASSYWVGAIHVSHSHAWKTSSPFLGRALSKG